MLGLFFLTLDKLISHKKFCLLLSNQVLLNRELSNLTVELVCFCFTTMTDFGHLCFNVLLVSLE